MPSDPRVEMALRAVSGSLDRYRSAVINTVEELRGYLASHRTKSKGGDGDAAARLGAFARGRVDVDRFSTLVVEAPPDDPETLKKIEKAFDILRTIAAGEDDLFTLKLKPGTRLREAVAARLGEIGRSFAAARLAGLVTQGRLNSGRTEDLLAPMPFGRWNVGERRLAPPLVVELEGADLHAGDLTEFLDGGVKLLLVVKGDCPPAPLARLITPGTLVLQTAGERGLDRVDGFDGPAAAALVPEDAAQFIHDPARGPDPWSRIEVFGLPERPPRSALGGMSVRQQTEELEQLKALAQAPSAAVAAGEEEGGAPAEPENPVDRLAAWLLTQADLRDVE